MPYKDPEKKKAHNKAYQKTYNGRKSYRIFNWKNAGIIFDDFEWLYDFYINCRKCEYCEKDFINGKDRHLDHNHNITYDNNVRGILCRTCNTKDVLNQ